MKMLKKFVSLLTAAALIALLPNANALQASAAGKTIYIRYDTDLHEWRMQIGEWEDGDAGMELYYLNNGSEREKALDGDTLVVLPNASTEESDSDENSGQQTGNVNVQVNARLSNLTVNRTDVVISATSIDECYVFGDSYAAINGDVTNAYVYDNAKCTFNNNVTNLRLIASQANDVDTDVSVGGTVGYASVSNSGGVIREYWNFVAGSFYYDNASGVMTDPSQYSTSGSAPAAAAAQTTASAPQTQNNKTSNSNEYDDVPKTGENNLLFLLLLAVSALSFAGCCMALSQKKVE